jgi:peptidoglycan hydrolase-like protein with peptidoglycan-binding domain
MRPYAALAGVLLAGIALTPVAHAQAVLPAPAYVATLSPAAVQSVQGRLRDAGVYFGAVDGVWGPETEAALQRFQQAHQLQVTGQLNQATIATLGLDPNAFVTAAAPPPPAVVVPVPVVPDAAPLTPASVQAVQARLKGLGFYTGAVDGIWGPATQDALAQFQQGRGLQPNGQLNTATLAALGFDPNAVLSQQ